MSIRETIRYGAAELKSVYNRNLAIALGISVIIHLFLVFLYIFVRIGSAAAVGKAAPVAKIKLTNLAPPPPPTDAAPPPPPPMVPPELQNMQTTGGTGLAVRAGTPIAVPDALVAPDAGDFATKDVMSAAGSKAGDGNLPTFDPAALDNKGDQGPQRHEKFDTEEDPDPYAFNGGVEVMPSYSDEDLMRRVKYPEIARRNGIEGRVIVRALIGKDGKVEKTLIDEGSNKALEEAAVAAVKETIFTSAKQNNAPVKVWIQIPVLFSLEQSN
jgi:periplasmic protein TonB